MILSTLKTKLIAIGAAIGAIMYGYIKYLRAKNERLEHNEEVREEIDEIEVKQQTDKSEALANEPEHIREKVKANLGKSRRGRASRL